MEKVLINLCFILFIVYFYKKNRQGIHILQLENYYNDRYANWIKNNYKTVFSLKSILLLIIPVIVAFFNVDFALNLALILESIALLLLIIFFKKRKEKKPFVITARIKRMYFTFAIIIAVVGVLVNILDIKIGLIIISVISIIGHVFVYLVNLINRPVEKFIRRGFCNKAKKNLKSVKDLKVIGITGSYGKTSTKYAVNTILSQKYNTLMTPESYNTTMGVVRTVNEKLKPMHNLFICEMGAKYVGDIKEITDIVEPTYGILTAIGPQHLDTFKSLENVSKTKLELVDSLPQEDGIAFVNWEDENIRKVRFSKKIVKYGLSDSADYYAENIDISEKGSTFDVVMPKKRRINIRTKLLGELNILNIVAAIAVGDTLGLSEEQLKMGVKYLRPVTHRLELKQNPNGSIIIDDAYNSNVKGANMALDVLKTFEKRKRILITPGIVELGNKSYEINKELGKKAAKSCDYIILVGVKQTMPILEGVKEAKFPEKNVYIAKHLDDALQRMNNIIDSNSVVLIENDLPDNYL